MSKYEIHWRQVPLSTDRVAELAFDNGYGASVLWKLGGIYEVMVLDRDGKPDYTTSVTNDVVWTNRLGLDTVLDQIAALGMET